MARRVPSGRMLAIGDFYHDEKPIMLTEFGGIACSGSVSTTVKNAWGYSVCSTEELFAKQFTELLEVVLALKVFGGFCYTQLTDTFQEANGLLRADRSPKLPIN